MISVWPTLRLSTSRRTRCFKAALPLAAARRPSAMLHFEKHRDRLGAIANFELFEQIAQVEFDRVDRHAEFLGELIIGLARTEGRQQAALPQRQILQRVGAHLADVDK